MLLAHKGAFLRKALLLTFTISIIIPAASLLIQNVFAYSDTESSSVTSSSSILTGIAGIDQSQQLLSLDTILPPKFVTVTVITEPTEGLTYGSTVRDALTDLGIALTTDLEVQPPLDHLVTDGMHIRIAHVTRDRQVETQPIPFTSRTMLDDTREIDTTTVVQTGRAGEKKVIYENVYINDILEYRQIVREEILANPVSEIVALGTKRVFRSMSFGGDSFTYWKVLHVFATSYDSHCKGCNEWTATGARLRKGICAVDPKVIPMHTRFYVPGYGFCQAEDTGGAIKGLRIDLGYKDLREVQGQWSAHSVDIFLMD